MISNLALLGEYSTEGAFSFPRDLRLFRSRPAAGGNPVLMMVIDLDGQELDRDVVDRLDEFCSFLATIKNLVLPIHKLSLEDEQLIAIQPWPNFSSVSLPQIATAAEARKLLFTLLEITKAADMRGFVLDAFFPSNLVRSGKRWQVGSLSSLAYLLDPDPPAPEPLPAIAATLVQLSCGDESVTSSKDFTLLDRHLPFSDIELFDLVKQLLGGTLSDPDAALQRLKPAPKTAKPGPTRSTPNQSTPKSPPSSERTEPITESKPRELSDVQLLQVVAPPEEPLPQSPAQVPVPTAPHPATDKKPAPSIITAEKFSLNKPVLRPNPTEKTDVEAFRERVQVVGFVSLAVLFFSALISVSIEKQQSSRPSTATDSSPSNINGEERQRLSTFKDTCGTPPKPDAIWWAVFGPAELLDTVRSTYCGDAYATSEGVQAASFDSAQEAATFATYLSNQTGVQFTVKDPQQQASTPASAPPPINADASSTATPSPATSTPLSTCGSNRGQTWWPVLGPAVSLNQVRKNYCKDAYVNVEGSLQVASFNSEELARALAERLSVATGVSFRVGQPKTP